MNEKVTGLSYITGIYQDIEAINDNLAAYKNLLVEMSPKNSEGINITDEQKEHFKRILPSIRFLIIRCYIKIASLKKINEFQEFIKENKQLYEYIAKEKVPDSEELFKYVIALNQCFISGVSEEFFNKASQIYSDYSLNQNNSVQNDGNNL